MAARTLTALAALSLVACSSETTGGSTSGPSGNEPQGAVNLEIYTAMNQDCPIGNAHIDLGNTKVAPPDVLFDGFAGASVACSVAASGAAFDASATLSKEGATFSFS